MSQSSPSDPNVPWPLRVWPLSAYRRWREASAREQVEDALKHLLDIQWEGQTATPEALKASLGLSDRQSLRLINDMTAQGLLRLTDNGLALTTQGERWALQITRAHRLWERYLADEARMPLDRIHREAHHREHQLTIQQVDELDAALGFPSRDPHGDPIPNRTGLLPPSQGKSIAHWPLDMPGRVVHIEDEPSLAYAQVLAEGLSLDQVLRVVENTPARLLLSDGENEYRLAPAIAANVFLAPVAVSERPPDLQPLSKLKDRQSAEIVSLDEACQGFTRRRFLDLGLTPGTAIHPELLNAFGDPRAYRVRGTLIALRKEQAAQIWVRPLATNSTHS
jgi:DtxR family transcriptional regulator, Mn-dependent transcriptional regulator